MPEKGKVVNFPSKSDTKCRAFDCSLSEGGHNVLAPSIYDNFKKLFPYRKSKHSMDMRKAEKFHIKQINTERYRKSAIPAMLRLLNEEDLKMKQAISNLNVTREPCLLNSISVKI